MKIALLQHINAYKIYVFNSEEEAINFAKNDYHSFEVIKEDNERFEEFEKRDGMTFYEAT